MPFQILKRIRLPLQRGKDFLALVFFAVLVGAFFYQTLIFGKLPVPTDTLVGLYHPFRDSYAASYPNGVPFKNFLITDPVRQQIPWRKTVIDDIKKGQLPLWNASSFSGTPLLANIQSGVLYPLNILFLIFPFETAWSLLIISQPLLAGVFLFLFLRNKKLSVAASLLGAIVFAFSGFSIAWLTWGTILSTWLWTPLGLLAVDRLESERKARWAILLIMSVICSYFAGHLQLFVYSFTFLVVYTLWVFRKANHRPWMTYGITLLFIACLTTPQWIAMLKWLPQTSRVSQGAAWQKEGFFIPIQHLVQFIAPDYFGNPATLNYWGTWNYGEMVGYVGVTGLALAIFGISVQTLFWTVVIALSLLFAVASPLSTLPYKLHLPVFSLLQPTRLLAVVDLGFSVLAAYGFSRLTDGKNRKTLIFVSFGLLCAVILVWISVLVHRFGINPENLSVAKRNIVFPTLLCVGFFLLISPYIVIRKDKLISRYSAIVGLLFIGILVFDLFRFGWKFTPFTDKAYFFPQTRILSFLENQQKPFRIMATDDRILPPNVNEYYGIESVSGYDPIHSSRYEEFIAAMERGKPDIQPPFGFDRIIAPKNIRFPLFQLLNVRYILSFNEEEGAGFRKVLAEGKTNVFENTHIIPRVYLAQQVLYKNSKQSVIDALYDLSFKPGVTAVTESQADVLNVPLTSSESVSIHTYTDREIDAQVTVTSPRLLVVGNMYDTGWHAFIDGKAAQIYRVNYLFMGVVVPGGNHTLTVSYR